MELEKLGRQLRLMTMLTQNRTLRIDEISEATGMNRRTIYRYLEAFREVGFIVKKEGRIYRLDHASPFFQKIAQGIHFSEEEAVTISQVINSVYSNSPQVRRLREKLAKLYQTDTLVKHGASSQMAENISSLFKAINEQRVVLLRNYRSASSGQVSNRIVEPYMFVNENSEVRCYEISSNTNKTFKVSRIESVEFIDLLWSHTSEHTPFFNDLFGFTGEKRMPVSLLLGHLATNLLIEEYPDAQRQLTIQPDGRQRLDTEVCSYVGIGRFVLGLYEDVEIVESPEFADYMKQRIANIYKQLPQ